VHRDLAGDRRARHHAGSVESRKILVTLQTMSVGKRAWSHAASKSERRESWRGRIPEGEQALSGAQVPELDRAVRRARQDATAAVLRVDRAVDVGRVPPNETRCRELVGASSCLTVVGKDVPQFFQRLAALHAVNARGLVV
jgi:hypothetical protein